MIICCVLKSGGIYTIEYVRNLRDQVQKNVSVPYSFVCFTDMDFTMQDVTPIKLKHSWPGWWAKLEIFRCLGPVLFFDLDTAIMNNLDDACNKLINSNNNCLYMLKPFNKEYRLAGGYASGIVAWVGCFKWLYNLMVNDPDEAMKYNGDQKFITKKLMQVKIKPIYTNKLIKGIYSYKNHCRKGIPHNAKVICFHGNPRPHTIGKPFYNVG